MATSKQLYANRSNATLSTGPKTISGKTASKFNALKHGLAAASPVLPHESAAQYEITRADLYTEFQPAGILEQMLVDQLALAHWRLVRTGKVEAAMLDLEIRTLKRRNGRKQTAREDDDEALAIVFLANSEKSFGNFYRYQSLAERAFYRAAAAIYKAQHSRLRKEREVNRVDPRTIAKPSLIPPGPKPPIGFVPAQPELDPAKFAVVASHPEIRPRR